MRAEGLWCKLDGLRVVSWGILGLEVSACPWLVGLRCEVC